MLVRCNFAADNMMLNLVKNTKNEKNIDNNHRSNRNVANSCLRQYAVETT